MKKVLFYAGLLVFAASCTEDELGSFSAQEQAKGITFVTESEPSTRMQWDDEGSSYVPFWYAEQDRIGIYGLNVLKGFGTNTTVAGVGFKDLTASMVASTYKATQSKKNGAFTSVSDADMLMFDGSKEARFVAVYPSTVKAEFDGAEKKIVLKNLPALATQTQAGTKGANPNVVMYALAKASKENAYDAVGEKVSLKFERPLSALVFKTKNLSEYVPSFGNLNTIKITTLGYDKDATDGALNADNGDILASTLTYDATKASIQVDTLTNVATFEAGETPTEGSNVTLNLNQAWTDDDLAVAVVKNVDRKAFRDKGVSESINVVFSFANIDLTSKTETVSVDFDGFMAFPEMDINGYKFLVTKGTSGNKRTLFVNDGTFSEIFNDDKTKIEWPDEYSEGDNGLIDLANIETIVSKVALTSDELATIKNFTGLKNLTLNANTSISAGTFTGLGAQIVKLELPKVTEYKDETAFEALVNLDINSYEFADEDVYSKFFNDDTKTTLETLKIEGMTSMRPTFGYDRTITFQGFTALETVALNPNGVALTANAFKGCTSLTSVTGIMDITNAPSAFEGAGAADFEVNVSTTIIPTNAFKGSMISSVMKDGEIVVPTEIGTSAFESNTAIELMDLSAATKIGASAFKGATGFKGVAATTSRGVVTINAETINDNILDGTAVVRVQFAKATKIGSEILGATPNTTLKQIKFLKQVAKLAEASAPFSAGYTNVDLFVSMAQEDVTDTDLEWMGGTFKSITREDKPFSEQ